MFERKSNSNKETWEENRRVLCWLQLIFCLTGCPIMSTIMSRTDSGIPWITCCFLWRNPLGETRDSSHIWVQAYVLQSTLPCPKIDYSLTGISTRPPNWSCPQNWTWGHCSTEEDALYCGVYSSLALQTCFLELFPKGCFQEVRSMSSNANALYFCVM